MERNKNNPWNRNNAGGNKISGANGKVNFKSSVGGEAKFKEAHARMQQSVKKHLEKDYESSEEEEELETRPILESVLKSYSQIGGQVADLERTQSHLENTFQSGSAVCLICIATVKRIDQIWSCESCYGFFHLNCIQRWAKDSLAQQKLIAEDRPNLKSLVFNWLCPKCRQEYEPDKIPRRYLCFCGQAEDPEYQQWLVPHSCGEKCSRPLKPNCGHTCLLLCHPGPCPPCPKVIQARCFCTGRTNQVRCSHKDWSCGRPCSSLLACKKHKCTTPCHKGQCPPCDKTEAFTCLCGAQTKRIPCAQLSWQCDKVCGKKLSCGQHKCDVICHPSSECGTCPRTQPRSCPCGKSIEVLPCEQDIPTCGGTCDKVLDCNLHTCPQRCHSSPCGSCLEIVLKRCRCGLNSKEVSCRRDYLCETKCKRMRDCNIHPCNRKCCDGNCAPCERPCGKTLSCGQHKCGSVCHRGPCYPCQQTRPLSCRCGQTSVTLPCVKRKFRPPKCNKRCRVPPDCDHNAREAHRCHFDSCPPCRQICSKVLKCGHTCPSQCHSAVLSFSDPSAKPATPCDLVNLSVELKKMPCPPCCVPVSVTCLGEHETSEIPCHIAVPSSCGRQCGRLLDCTNHRCQLQCHKIVNVDEMGKAGKVACEECEEKCELERSCEHKCKMACHPPPCLVCNVSIKMSCHCKITYVFIKCNLWQSASQTKRAALISCGNNCPKLLSCGHRCVKACHDDDCTPVSACRRKTKVTCPCKRIKKEYQCSLVSSSSVTVLCDDKCQEMKLNKLKEEEKSKEEARIAEEKRNKEELEKYEKKMQGRKRQRKRVDSLHNTDENIIIKHKYLLLLSGAVIAVIAAVVYMR